MKKGFLFALMTVAAFAAANAADLKVTRNMVESGSMKANMYSGGELLLTAAREKQKFANMGLSIGTKGGWYSFRSKNATVKYNNEKAGVWQYQGIFTADKKGAKLNVSQVVEINPMNAIDIDCAWNTPDMNNASDIGYFVTIDMKYVAGKNIWINDKAVKVENISKYGGFVSKYEEARVVFCKDDPAHEFSIVCGKCLILFHTVKDKTLTVRFYPQTKQDGKLQLSLNIKQ